MFGRRGLAACLSLALSFAVVPTDAPAAPPEGGAANATAAILPIEVEGELSETDRTTLTSELVAGLERGAFGIIPPAEVVAKEGDAASCGKPRCYKKIAEATQTTHVVKTKLYVVDRDYRIRIELVDGHGGNVLASAEDACEICGVSDVGGLIATAAATLRTKLDALASGPATMVLTSEPAGAIVTLDGEVAGTTPIESMPVIPGKHVIRVSREGYIAIEREVTFVEGVAEELSFALEKLPSRLPGRGWGWASLGVGVAALGGGLFLTALHDRQYKRNCDPNADPEPTKDRNGECKFLWNTKWAGVGTAIGGAALLTLGIAILVNSAGKTKKQKDKDAQASRRPQIGIGPGQVTLRGRF
jgi:TolB-like protein